MNNEPNLYVGSDWNQNDDLLKLYLCTCNKSLRLISHPELSSCWLSNKEYQPPYKEINTKLNQNISQQFEIQRVWSV